MITNGLCNAEHPDWPLRCCRKPHDDETHEGYGETWTDWDHRGPNADRITANIRAYVRARFWMSWSRLFIAWGFGLIGVLIVLTMVPAGWPHTAVLAVLAVAILALTKLVWDAVKFTVDNRRERQGART